MNKKWLLFLILAFAAGMGANALWNTPTPTKHNLAPVNVADATFYSQGDKPVKIFNQK